MASNSNNAFGVQKVAESSVRSTNDVWLDATTAGAQGAVAGSAGGPVAGAVSGVANFGVGLYAGFTGKADEQRKLNQERAQNSFVDSLSGRSASSGQRVGGQDYYVPQARSGMETGRYIHAEVEGDGSGDKKNGIGEIITDKNFNIKHVERGSATHEEGGEKRALSKGDIVFPSQGDRSKFNSILSNIKRYKLNGDPKAKKALEKERDSLPTETEDGEMRKGFNNRKALVKNALDKSQYNQDDQSFTDEVARKPSKQSDQNFLEGYYDDPTANTIKNQIANNSGLGGAVVNGAGSQSIRKEKTDIIEDHDKKYDYKRVGDTWNTRVKGSDKWTGINPAGDKVLDEKYGSTKTLDIQSRKAGSIPSPKVIPGTPTSAGTPSASNVKDDNNFGTTPPSTNDGLYDEFMKETPDRTNYGKYAGVAHDLIKGSQDAEVVPSRSINYDKYDYRDTSDNRRQASIENRNYMTRAFMQRADRSGSQGTGSQISAQHLRGMEDINSSEADKQLGIQNMNTQQGNTARYQNLEIARQDDDKNAQNRGAKANLLAGAAGKYADLASLSEQQAYMRDRNKKQDLAQAIGLKNMGTQKFRYDTEDLSGVKYIAE